MKKAMQDQLLALGFILLAGTDNVFVKDNVCVRSTEDADVYQIGKMNEEKEISWEADTYSDEAIIAELQQIESNEEFESEENTREAVSETESHNEDAAGFQSQHRSDETDRATL